VNAPLDAWSILNRNAFFVRNAVKRSEAKTSDKLDLYDPTTRELLLECREPGLGLATRAARFFGGTHDRGTSFDLVAGLPGEGRQVLRVTRGSATLTLGGKPLRIFNHDQELLGSLKPKVFAIGHKFEFNGERGIDSFLLVAKTRLLRGASEFFVGNQPVAWMSGNPAPEHEAFFRDGKFGFSFAIAAEVRANSPLRPVLLAFAIAQHRIRV
jgi:hypothetical protein